MAAYAAVVSLMNTMEQIMDHPRLSTSLDKNEIQCLQQMAAFFLDFIESYSSGRGSKETKDLEGRIASAAHVAEDVIESHIVDQINLPRSTDHQEKKSSFWLRRKIKAIKKKVVKDRKKLRSGVDKSILHKVMKNMESIKKKVMKVKEEGGFKGQQHTNSMPAASSRPLTSGKTTMVGFDDYLTQLLEGLTGPQSSRKIISIVGMGGIGKTTLARNVCENLLIVEYFHLRGWVTVSQEYNVREILLQTLSSVGGSTNGVETTHKLGEQLYKTLSGRRYLIVLDDMWSIDAWNEIKFFFPDNHNGSRIIVTTRDSDVASHLGSVGLVVDFLDEDKSWDLFCGKAFGREGCPPHLENIGRKIVTKCKGLPLLIVVIGGLLGKSSRRQEYWVDVAKDISSIMSSVEVDQCLNILSLSYNHLPVCLKPCILYLGIFPEDHKIKVSRLIKLWVAEGFIKPNKNQSLEEVAKGYIKDLIDRNLILVHEWGRTGSFKTCYIHDLVRDLCLRIAKEEKFLCIMRVLDTPRNIGKERRIIIHGSTREYKERGATHTLKSTSLARSITCEGDMLSDKPRLLRVFSDADIDIQEINMQFLHSIFKQVNLRLLAYFSGYWTLLPYVSPSVLPLSISLLWNVQTIIITRGTKGFVAPSQIWEMPRLRHLKLVSVSLPDPRPSDEQEDGIVLQHLQTLKRVSNFRCSEEACKRMPNIKKLYLVYDGFSGEGEPSLSDYCLHNISRFNKLESLYYVYDKVPKWKDSLQNLTFPMFLKKLFLCKCGLQWNDMSVIGSLPHLEVLRLGTDSVTGPVWDPIEGQFLCLKFLEIYCCYGLIKWSADKSHFPVLENLFLSEMKELDEIPFGIGEIPTLKVIQVYHCNMFAAISAMEILEEQEINLGNHTLQVKIVFWDADDADEFREKVKLEGFTCHNFQILLF